MVKARPCVLQREVYQWLANRARSVSNPRIRSILGWLVILGGGGWYIGRVHMGGRVAQGPVVLRSDQSRSPGSSTYLQIQWAGRFPATYSTADWERLALAQLPNRR